MKEEGFVSLGDVVHDFIDKGGPSGTDFIYIDISSIDRAKKRITDSKTIV